MSTVGEFLPMQVKYGGKRKRSLLKFNFPKGGSWKITGPLPQNLWRRRGKMYPKNSVFFGDNR